MNLSVESGTDDLNLCLAALISAMVTCDANFNASSSSLISATSSSFISTIRNGESPSFEFMNEGALIFPSFPVQFHLIAIFKNVFIICTSKNPYIYVAIISSGSCSESHKNSTLPLPPNCFTSTPL
jgi:hypothetical protein